MSGRLTLLHAADAAPWAEQRFTAALASLPDRMREEVLSLRRWQDRQARVLGRLLLRAGLTRLGLGRCAGLESWGRDPSGRPRLLGCPADFSISHASGLAVCALCPDGRTGVDVEPAAPQKLEELRLAFGQGEWAAIQAARDPSLALLQLWTAKEAALKADGRGLAIEPAEVDARGPAISVRGALWHLSAPDLGLGWVCGLATPWPAPEVEVVQILVMDLVP